MMRLDAVMRHFPDLDMVEVTGWIEQGWVRSEAAGPDDWTFQEIDLARIGLIHDLRRGMGIAQETVPLVLSLLDQVYELRALLQALSQALGDQPPEVRAAILSTMARATAPRT